jgi:formamidopyrimidine-DNA glycosylase
MVLSKCKVVQGIGNAYVGENHIRHEIVAFLISARISVAKLKTLTKLWEKFYPMPKHTSARTS